MLGETGFVKKGTKSVGGAPQYCGTVGKIANCQIGVFLAYATSHGPVLLDRTLYLPKEWADNPARCAETGVPAELDCVPEPTLGKQLLEQPFAAGVPAAWVPTDSNYGGDTKLRRYLEERAQPFVLAVDLLPLTMPAVRHLLFALVWQPPPGAEHVLHWSGWRRRHQARQTGAHHTPPAQSTSATVVLRPCRRACRLRGLEFRLGAV